MSSSNSQSSSCSARSGSSNSTCEYSQVPFAEFSLQVAELCKIIFPLVPAKDIVVEHLRGGSSNRVVGISLNLDDKNVSDTRLSSPHSPDSSATDSTRTRCFEPSPSTSRATSSKALSSPPSSPTISLTDLREVSPGLSSASVEVADPQEVPPLPPSPTVVALHMQNIVHVSQPYAFFAAADVQELPPLPSSPVSATSSTVESTSLYDNPKDLVRVTIGSASTVSSSKNSPHQFILRVPRWDEGQVGQEIALLNYLSTQTTIPVPKVYCYDLTADNAISSPYVLQERIVGESMLTMYEKMTNPEKMSFVTEFAQLLCKLQGISSPVSGELFFQTPLSATISSHPLLQLNHAIQKGQPPKCVSGATSPVEISTSTSSEISFEVRHFNNIWAEEDGHIGTKVAHEDHFTLAMLLLLFKRHKDHAIFHHPSSAWIDIEDMDQLSQVAREMDGLNCLGDDKVTLFHGDLEARNIMCYIDEQGCAKIAGVLDWDDAIFAPGFVSCRPPNWLWEPDTEEVEERQCYEEPLDPDMRKLKGAFETLVGPEFLSLSYPPQYRLARQLFQLGRSGIHSNEDHGKADGVIAEWNDLRNSILKYLGKDG